MIRSLIAAVTVSVAVSGASVAAASPAASPEPPARPVWARTACVTEDSVNCYWNAEQMGNGNGQSFYVRLFPGRAQMICVMYVNKRYAASHDYCTTTR